jgi:nickel-dependent lactate racemase
MTQPGMQVSVIVDDYTRKTPIDQVLPLILEELHAAGIARADVRIVIAAGSHRLMSQPEIIAKIGSVATGGYEIIQASSSDLKQLVYLGETTLDIPAWINRCVAEADFRIGIGMITPHLDAGFSGGAKIILPGVCGTATIDAFHQASAFIQENQVGKVDAPLRYSLEQFVAEKAPLHFIANLILTLQGKVYGCVAGDAVQAHRAGAKYAQEVYGVPIERRYPVVIANCYPYDQDLWQSIKGIWCGDLLVEDGGTLIVVSAAPEGSQTHTLLPAYIGREAGELQDELLAGKAQDPMAAATGIMVSNLRRRIHLALVSSGLTRPDGQAMHIPFYTKIEEAMAEIVGCLPSSRREGSVAVMPYAGVTLPMYRA